jgi:hypothetical protein
MAWVLLSVQDDWSEYSTIRNLMFWLCIRNCMCVCIHQKCGMIEVVVKYLNYFHDCESLLLPCVSYSLSLVCAGGDYLHVSTR